MIRLLVTGRNGQVASSLLRLGPAAGNIEVIAMGRPELDLENPVSVAHAIDAARPDLVVNAAAYTAVDKAESAEARAYAVNRDGAGAVAAAAARRKAPLIHLSTDYVYSGDKASPYVESDPTGPLSVYGRSKLAGELAVRAAHPGALILRTSWVYSPFGANFVKTMLRLGGERSELRVVDDQTGNPTSALDLARAILRIAPDLAADVNGNMLLHLGGEGSVSWCGLARHIFEVSSSLGGAKADVTAITTSQYETAARRPRNSGLSTEAFQARFGFKIRPWQEGVAETVKILLA